MMSLERARSELAALLRGFFTRTKIGVFFKPLGRVGPNG
jgi:hypothetical protein